MDRDLTDKKPKRRHPNRSERRSLRAAEVAVFVRQYGRRAQKGVEPNDRHYSRDLERTVRRLDPKTLDSLLRDDED
jgi:hypothetical protein